MAGDSRTSLRTVVICPRDTVGGAEQWLLSVLKEAPRLQVEIVLLDARPPTEGATPLTDEFTRRGLSVHVCPMGTAAGFRLAGVRRLRELLRRLDPDVALVNGVQAQKSAGLAAALAGVPLVWVKHDHAHDAWLARLLAKLSSRVVAVSEQVALATGRDDVVVVPPPRPAEPLPAHQARRRLRDLGVPDGPPVLAMLTSLAPHKGVDTAIEALAQRPRWHLVVFGGEESGRTAETQRLRALATRLGVAERIHLVGYLADAPALISGVDAVALLARSDLAAPAREGYGSAALESMVAGVPLIARPSLVPAVPFGTAGVLDPGLASLNETKGVAACLQRLEDPALRARLGTSLPPLTLDHPSASECANRVSTVLAEVARRPGAGLVGGPPLSVVTTVLNEGAGVDALLEQLVPQLGEDDEIVVVDGGSTDDTADRIETWSATDPRVRLLSRPGLNISAGRNAGVTEAVNDLVAFTDAGCDPAPGWVDAFRAAAAEPDPADLVTGVYRTVARPGELLEAAMVAVGYPDPVEARRPTPLVRVYGALFGRVYDASLLTGRCAAVTRKAWAAAGGFPENLATAEDVLFGQAVVANGGRAVLTIDALVDWHQRATLKATAWMYYRYGHGGGLSGNPRLIGRDLLRAVVYPAGVALVVFGGLPGLVAGVLGGLAYLSLPLRRAAVNSRGLNRLLVPLTVPYVAAVRDLSKAAGCLAGLVARVRRRPAGPETRDGQGDERPAGESGGQPGK